MSAGAQRIEAGGAGVIVRGLVLAPDPAHLASVGVRASLAGAPDLVALHLVSNADRKRPQEPGSFDADGCRAWRAGEGSLGFACRLVPPRGAPSGRYALVALASDDAGGSAVSDALPLGIAPLRLVQVAGAPVDADGNATGVAWGGWAARPGARGVPAANYVRIVNAGDDDNATAIVDFGTGGFRGALDPRFSIPTVGNLEFAWWEAKGANAQAEKPRHGQFTWHEPTAGGASERVQFTSKGSVIFLVYRIKAMPDVLPVQAYGASYVVTEG